MTEQQKLTFPMLMQQLNSLMLRDKQRFARRLHGVKKVKNPDAQQAIYQEMAKEIEQAAGKVVLREAARPEITYPENLPVSQKKQDILEAVRDHQVVIVAGETGSGKTTQLPKICMELGRGVKGLIGHTQPRRLAARTVANRIAEELQTEPGGCIGYKVRFSDRVSDNTMVKLMTDGILLAEIQQDRLLMQYDTIIIDEAHERSLNIDFLLGYLKELLPRRPDLKIIITSATIDPERFARHFSPSYVPGKGIVDENLSAEEREIAEAILPDDAPPIIEVSGRTYPVEIRYRPLDEEDYLSDDEIEEQLKNDASKLSVEELLYAATLTDDAAKKEDIYKKTVQLYPNDYRAYNNLAELALKSGNTTAAKQYLAQALQHNAKSSEANANMALLSLVEGNTEAAEQALGKAAEAKNYKEVLGNLNIAKGNYAQAAQDLAGVKSN
ncbi:DEAD/DEAH box helicase, partial [uncultured Enterobacter sp.]|uniref:DEAD/DEAH box helicase n=1 Tax=uncultured Enterobacter sp. TaxID=238202 RepID=UPI002595334E